MTVDRPSTFLELPDLHRPVELVRGTVRLEVREVDDEIRVSLLPVSCAERNVTCEREGDGRVIVYALSASARRSSIDELMGLITEANGTHVTASASSEKRHGRANSDAPTASVRP